MPFRLLSSFLLFAAVVLAADARLLSLVMPDAKMISGIDVDRVKATPFGRFLIDQVPAGDQAFQNFSSATGLDPRRDIREIVMASPGAPERKTGLVLVRGTFDAARIGNL